MPYSLPRLPRALVDLLYSGSCVLATSAMEHLVILAASLGLHLDNHNTNIDPINNNPVVEGAEQPGVGLPEVEVQGKELVVEEEVRGVKTIREEEEEAGDVKKRKVEVGGEVESVDGETLAGGGNIGGGGRGGWRGSEG